MTVFRNPQALVGILLALCLCVATRAGEPAVELGPPRQVDGPAPPSFTDRLWQDVDLSCADHAAFYSWPNLGLLGLGIGAMAPVANTSADRAIRDWYQGHVRDDVSDDFADAVNLAGQLWVVVPLAVEVSGLLGHGPEDYRTAGEFREWSNRSLRAVAVGYPPTIALYGLLGSTRPVKNDSRWHPFQNFHGVSGHTFIGAIPFLTAASMTDDPLVQAPLVAGSFLTGWSRLHLDRHYFSQVALGWWLAYLSVCSVNATQEGPLPWTLVPLPVPDATGVGVYVEY